MLRHVPFAMSKVIVTYVLTEIAFVSEYRIPDLLSGHLRSAAALPANSFVVNLLVASSAYAKTVNFARTSIGACANVGLEFRSSHTRML